jgi:class 3 adenylate cyclase
MCLRRVSRAAVNEVTAKWSEKCGKCGSFALAALSRSALRRCRCNGGAARRNRHVFVDGGEANDAPLPRAHTGFLDALLSEYQRLLRRLFEEMVGREVEVSGDSALAAFPTSKQATHAAVAA